MLFQDDRAIFEDNYFDKLLYVITSYNNNVNIYRIYANGDDYLSGQEEYFRSGSQITIEQYEKYISPLNSNFKGSFIAGMRRYEDYACNITNKKGNQTSVRAQLVHIGYIRDIPNALYEYRRRQLIQRLMMFAQSNLVGDVIKIIVQNIITLNNQSG